MPPHQQAVYILIRENKSVLIDYSRPFANHHCGESEVLSNHNIITSQQSHQSEIHTVNMSVYRYNLAVVVVQLMSRVNEHSYGDFPFLR
jgi:hypothetical protein